MMRSWDKFGCRSRAYGLPLWAATMIKVLARRRAPSWRSDLVQSAEGLRLRKRRILDCVEVEFGRGSGSLYKYVSSTSASIRVLHGLEHLMGTVSHRPSLRDVTPLLSARTPKCTDVQCVRNRFAPAVQMSHQEVQEVVCRLSAVLTFLHQSLPSKSTKLNPAHFAVDQTDTLQARLCRSGWNEILASKA